MNGGKGPEGMVCENWVPASMKGGSNGNGNNNQGGW